MSRLPGFTPDQLDPAQRALYDAIANGPRRQGTRSAALVDEAGRLAGPFNAMLLSPNIGERVQALGAALRYASTMTGRAREIATLIVARDADGRYEWQAHAALGRAAGLEDGEIEAIKAGTWSFADATEQTVAEVTREVLDQGDLTDTRYAEVAATLGEATLFELLTLIGYYRLLALQLRVFGVDDIVPPID